MKILFILPIALFPLKGCSFRCYRQATALKDQNIDVVILCPKSDVKYSKQLLEVSSAYPVFDLLPNIGRSYIREFVTLLTAWSFIIKILRQEKPDIIHVHNPPDTMAFITSYICSHLNIPVVFDINDLGPEDIQSNYNKSTLSKIILLPIARILERNVIKRSSAIIVVSDSVKNHLLKTRDYLRKMNIPVLTVYNSVDIGDIDKIRDIEKKEPYILYVGTLSSGFLGLEELISSFKYIANKFNVKLKIIGDGPLRKKLLDLVRELEMEDKVDIIGHLNPAIVLQYVKSAVLCVVPYRKTILTDITIPTKIFEYMVIGKAIVRPNLAGLDEVLGKENIGCYEADNQKSLINSIETLLGNKVLLHKVGNLNRDRFLCFSYQKVIKQLMTLYQAIQKHI